MGEISLLSLANHVLQTFQSSCIFTKLNTIKIRHILYAITNKQEKKYCRRKFLARRAGDKTGKKLTTDKTF